MSSYRSSQGPQLTIEMSRITSVHQIVSVETELGGLSLSASCHAFGRVDSLHASGRQRRPQDIRRHALDRLCVRARIRVLQTDGVQDVDRSLTVPSQFDERDPHVEPKEGGSMSDLFCSTRPSLQPTTHLALTYPGLSARACS
jgi:hypothetical protein